MTIRDIAIAFGFKVDESSERKAENAVQSLKSKATKLLGAIGLTVSIAGIASGIRDCVALASEVEEMENKFNVVFQGISEEVDAWAQNFADAIGRNKNDIKTYLADQQNLLVGFGMTREAGAELSEQMTSLALDLASFGNLDEATAVNAMTKAVMGESEAAKTIGAVLNDATRAEAMHALGLSGTYNELDQLTKMQVNYQAILSQSPDAIGDCERSLGSYQSTLKQFQAKLKEIKTLIGQFFMPAIQKVLSIGSRGLTVVRDWVQKLNAFADKVGGAEKILGVLGAALAATLVIMNAGKIASFVSTIGKMAKGFDLAKLKVVGLFAVFLLLALVIQDFIAFMKGDNSLFGTMLEKAGVDVDEFRSNLLRIWQNIKTALGAVWQGIKNTAIPLFQGIWSAIKTVFSAIGDVIMAVAPQLAEFVGELANGEVDTAKWEKVGEVIVGIAAAIAAVIAVIKVVTAVQKAYAVVQGIVNAVMNASPITWIILAIVALIAIIVVCVQHWDQIKAAFLAAWEAIKQAWSVVVDFFRGIWDGIVSAFSGVIDWFSNLFSQAWEAIKNVFSAVGEFFQGVWDSIVSIFTTIGTAVGDAISGAVKGAINAVISGAVGIINGFISAINFAIGIINKIPGVNISKLTPLEAPQLAEGGYVRPNKPMPVIVGDNKKEGEIISPISKMKEAVVSALQSFVSGASAITKARAVAGSSAALAAGTSNSSKTITQNVNINNQFNGDRAGQKKSSEAMDKASEDATSQMARALALI